MIPIPSRKDLPASLSDLQAEMNNLIERLWHTGLTTRPLDGQEWAPSVDVLEEPDRFVVKAEVPGPTPDLLKPRISHTAGLLWGVYLLLSVAELKSTMKGFRSLALTITCLSGLASSL